MIPKPRTSQNTPSTDISVEAADVQVAIEEMCRAGENVQKDFKFATAWFRKAADQGYAVGQLMVGQLYEKGESVPQDHSTPPIKDMPQPSFKSMNSIDGALASSSHSKAKEWYRRAAEQEHVDAIFKFAWLYENGYGVVKGQG
ncbi:hypothetical protein BGX33_005206 [Mortierella sp. NVP41]|nr:hypothetical protein BGX33_005206 [Mortierella sp. NVP41]